MVGGGREEKESVMGPSIDRSDMGSLLEGGCVAVVVVGVASVGSEEGTGRAGAGMDVSNRSSRFVCAVGGDMGVAWEAGCTLRLARRPEVIVAVVIVVVAVWAASGREEDKDCVAGEGDEKSMSCEERRISHDSNNHYPCHMDSLPVDLGAGRPVAEPV